MEILSILLPIALIASVYSLLSLGLNMQLGYGGIINFGVVAYAAVAAYTYVILVQPPGLGFDTYKYGFGLPMWVGLLGGCASAVLFAWITGWPCLRLRGEYLALTTFAFAEVVESLSTNMDFITNGPLGFSGLAQPFQNEFTADFYPYFLALLFMTIVFAAFLFQQRITKAPFGKVLKAIRDDELLTKTAGIQVPRYRMQAFLLGALLSGLAGVMYIWYTSYVSPSLFTANITFVVWIALIIGGLGSNVGAIIGPVFLIAFQEIIRALATTPLIAERVSAIQLFLEGILLITVLMIYPGGLAGAYNDRKRSTAGPSSVHAHAEIPLAGGE